MTTVYRADGVPADCHLDYWREVVGTVFMPIELRGDFGPSAPAEMRTATLGPIRLNDSRTAAPFRTVRTTRHIRASTPDVYLFGLLVDGRLRVEQDGRQAEFGPGDLSFVDPTRPSTRACTAMRTVTISVPKTMIGLRDRGLAELTAVRIPGDRGATAVASAMARQLAEHVDRISASEAAQLGTAVVDTLTTALAGQFGRSPEAPEVAERSLLHRIYAFVEQHLADPELSLAGIAAAHHISLRYLHKQFEGEAATLGEWIRRRRLDRCRQDLLDPTARNRPVAAIGARWGLPDAAHFSRAFRAAYGMPPGEYRRMHLMPMGVHAR